MPALRFVLLLLYLLIQRAATSDANNYFINPSSGNGINPVWTLGDDQVISWKTTLGVFNVSIWQQSLVQQSAASQGNIYSKIHPTDSVTNFTWPVQLYGFDLEYSNVFFLWIDPDEAGGFVSCYFNISRPTASSTREAGSTTGSALVQKTGGAGVVATAPASATATATGSGTGTGAMATGSTDNETGALTGPSRLALGVGLGVGVPLLGAVVALGVVVGKWRRDLQVQGGGAGGKEGSSSKATLASAAGGAGYGCGYEYGPGYEYEYGSGHARGHGHGYQHYGGGEGPKEVVGSEPRDRLGGCGGGDWAELMGSER
ncbi:uncharacterized protein BO66DRAFT_425495 [Aspergillus aculeatinus CBS 121060]|uniref:Uncharacterized protein n=1 Tax=Aspergillus aculeatinus CBS 121060 TaxID=1448322 RepID=A0ACD1HM36_9EURO|nr:hypothetical protein BO66DRAFT_425495 [Aspergillus aculeatinus CBS 121060]RAH74494.1 hypothetical protein BO66DRAFT_425495 [Aspergillus aculeatinus CBS 121060]